MIIVDRYSSFPEKQYYYSVQSNSLFNYLVISDDQSIFSIDLLEDDVQTSLFLDRFELIEKKELKFHSFDLFGVNIHPVCLVGTEFQVMVWEELLKIGKGEVVDYTTIANNIDKPKSVRAVANAIAKNNLAVLIPCHRVIRKNKQLSGYKWGSQTKQTILQFEQSFND